MVCVVGACSYDVFAGLQVLSAYAGYVFLGEELPPEFARVLPQLD